MGAQAFALVGTLVGVLAIAKGVGPRPPAEIAYHIAIVIVLAAGRGVATAARSTTARIAA